MTTTIPAAEIIASTLADHPDGITTRDLAKAAGVGQTTAQTTLTAMESAGSARRAPGQTNGNRRTADVWRPITDTTPDETTSPEATTDATDVVAVSDPATDDSPTPDVTPVTETAPTGAVTDDNATPDATPDVTPATQTAPAAAVTEDNATPDVTPVTEAAPAVAVPIEAPVSGAPAPTTPRQPDLKVLIMAGVLGDHPEGVSAQVAIAESGLAVATADTILAAMEVAGAAHRLPADADGAELWVRGDGDLATVDPANAPTHVTCPTCGHTRRVRRASAAPRRTTATGRVAPEINTDGSDRLTKNGLRNQVEAFMRDLGSDHEVTPGTVGRELGGRSSGAVANAMSRLVQVGVLILACEAPVKYALATDAPAATPEVAAFMTSP
jgi:hypothetical protein